MWMEGEKRTGEIKKEIRVGHRLWKTLVAVLRGDALHYTAINFTGNGPTPRRPEQTRI